MFECQEYIEVEKSKFICPVDLLWKDLMAFRRMHRKDEVRNGEVMEGIMTRHFIAHDGRDKFYLKLQRLK